MTKSTKEQEIKDGTVRAFTQEDVNKYWKDDNTAWLTNLNTGKSIAANTVRRWIKMDGGFVHNGVAYTMKSSSLFAENRIC